MSERVGPISDNEFVVLEAIVAAGGDQPFATIAGWLSVESAQAAVAGLLGRGLVTIDRVVELPAGQTVDRPVSPLTPSVRSTSRLNVNELSRAEAAAAIADPDSWLPSVHVPTWFEVTTTPEADAVYYRSWEDRQE